MRLANPFLHAIDSCYKVLIKTGSNLQSLFLLYMRVAFGHQFIITGWIKLHSIEETAGFFASLHIVYPYPNAYLVGWTELLGGFCLFLGFAARLASIPLIIIMLVALGTTHAAEISNVRIFLQPVQQVPYLFLITCLLMFLFGPGRVSIDAWLKRWSEKRPKY